MKVIQFILKPTTEISEIVTLIEKVIKKFKAIDMTNQEEQRFFFTMRNTMLKEIIKIHKTIKILNTNSILFFELTNNKQNIIFNAILYKEEQ